MTALLFKKKKMARLPSRFRQSGRLLVSHHHHYHTWNDGKSPVHSQHRAPEEIVL